MTEHRPLNTSPLPVKLRVEDYLLLDREGAFEEYRKTELIEGEVFYMNAQHQAHSLAKGELYFLIRTALTGVVSLKVAVECSVSIPPNNVPEPDIVVAENLSGVGLIPVEAVRLVVEVADSTLERDLSAKAAVYARAGVPEYWVADVNSRTIMQMWSPDTDRYAERTELPFGAMLRAKTIDGLEIETGSL